MALCWAAERRLDYIDWRLATAGHVRRENLVRVFGVGGATASADLNEFIRRYPGVMVYDKTARRYKAATPSRSVRGLTAEVLKAIDTLQVSGHPMAFF
jgi:hypothetical protein